MKVGTAYGFMVRRFRFLAFAIGVLASGCTLLSGLDDVAISQADPPPPIPSTDGGDGADTSLDGTPPDADADAASATLPFGLDAVGDLEFLPFIPRDVRAIHASSYDREAGNHDWSHFLGTDAKGDQILFDAVGPGCVYRMWFTGFDPKRRLHAYFDGESTPRLDVVMADMFDDRHPPFVAPLVGDDTISSGGFFTYLPLPYAKSLRITATPVSTQNPDSFYYNIDAHALPPDTKVTSWTGNEDSSAARRRFTLPGFVDASTGATSSSGTSDLAAGASAVVLDTNGPRTITALELRVPGVFPTPPDATTGTVTDNGRAHKGTSQMTFTIANATHGVMLRRRLDYGVSDQRVHVTVDGVDAGDWSTPGSDGSAHWRDAGFLLPPALTVGKSKITVMLTFVSGAKDFNEFYYWVTSLSDDGEHATDELDVGNGKSESDHAYAVTGQTWNGTQVLRYPSSDPLGGALQNLRIRATWDEASTPQIDAPIGPLFGLGTLGAGSTRGIPAGLRADGTLYLRFPMPFARRAHIELVNVSKSQVKGLSWRVEHAPFSSPFDDVGSFAAIYTEANLKPGDLDTTLLDATGSGKIVGVVVSERGPKSSSFLEGNDRFVVDGRRTFSVSGTGTEDLFNGGWYFKHGVFALPTHGCSAIASDANGAAYAMHRFFLSDSMPYADGARFSLQHGPLDDDAVTAWTLTYVYRSEPRLHRTDHLEIGDPASEAAHAYAVTGETWSGSRTQAFEGEHDQEPLTANGRAHRGTSSFSMAVDPNNRGVFLRRMFDQHIGNQRASVSVDGQKVGDWYTPSANPTFAWRDDDFVLPATFTAGKSKITITIAFVSSDDDWNEFQYEARSVVP